MQETAEICLNVFIVLTKMQKDILWNKAESHEVKNGTEQFISISRDGWDQEQFKEIKNGEAKLQSTQETLGNRIPFGAETSLV